MPDKTPSATSTQRDDHLDDSLDVATPERMKALGDPFRVRLCNLVLERAMSVTELAERTGRPKGSVAYHVDVLVDAGLLHVVRTRQVRAIEERFYGRTARTFVMPHDHDDFMFLGEVARDVDRDMVDQLAGGSASSDGRSGLATYRRARIPLDRVAEYTRRLHELAIEFIDEPRAGDVEFGLYLALFPTNSSDDERQS